MLNFVNTKNTIFFVKINLYIKQMQTHSFNTKMEFSIQIGPTISPT